MRFLFVILAVACMGIIAMGIVMDAARVNHGDDLSSHIAEHPPSHCDTGGRP